MVQSWYASVKLPKWIQISGAVSEEGIWFASPATASCHAEVTRPFTTSPHLSPDFGGAAKRCADAFAILILLLDPSPQAFPRFIRRVLCLCVILQLASYFSFLALIPSMPLSTGHLRPQDGSEATWRCCTLLLCTSPHPSPRWFSSSVLQASPPGSFPSQGTPAAGKQPRHRADPAAPCAYLSSSPRRFLSLAPCASCARAPREPARQVGLQPAFQPCCPPSCIIKYQILSWNADTVNSVHCSCLIYRINKVVKEFKDVFQTGPSFFSTCWRTHL